MLMGVKSRWFFKAGEKRRKIKLYSESASLNEMFEHLNWLSTSSSEELLQIRLASA